MGRQTSAQSLFEGMNAMQQQFWSQWLGSEGASPMGKQLEQSYQQQLDLGEKFVDQALQMQSAWVHQLCGAMKGNSGTPKEFKAMVDRMEETMDGMLKLRGDFWHGCFRQARELHMDRMPLPNGPETWMRLLETMQQQTREAMSQAQDAMSRASGDAEAGAATESTKSASGGRGKS